MSGDFDIQDFYEKDFAEKPEEPKVVQKPEKVYSITEAISTIRDLERDYSAMQNAMLMIRWKQGEIASRTEVKHGQNTIGKLADAAGVHENTLREAARVYEYFNGDLSVFTAWLEEGKGGKRRWYECQGLIRSNTDPNVLGADALLNRIVGRLEQTAFDMEKINELAHDDPEALGVLNKVVEEIRHFAAEGIKHFDKGGVPRSAEYLSWIRKQRCCVSRVQTGIEAHHIKVEGKGLKGSDFLAVPLSHKLHMEYHNIGKQSFEKKHNVDLKEVALSCIHRYLTGHWAYHILD